MRRQCVRPAAVLLALVLCTCTDAPTGPRRVVGRLALVPTYSREAREISRNLAAAGLAIDKVFVELRDEADAVRTSQLVDFPANQNEVKVSLEVKLKATAEQFAAKVELRSGETPIFSSTTAVVVKEAETSSPQTNPLKYVGPGAAATSLEVRPVQATIAQSGSQQFAAFAFAANESPVTDLPISGWTSSDATIATINDAGLAQGLKSGTVTITAKGLNDLTATATLHIVGAPSRLVVVSGDGQSAPAGSTLSQQFQIQVQSAAAEGVPGVTVNFQAVTAGGHVATATAVTDAQGLAATAMTLGSNAGSYQFRASIGGASAPSPVTITATAQAAAAAALTKVSGDAQIGTAGQLLPAPLVVLVADGFGNPVGGANVTFTRLTGGGTIGSPHVTTGADGRASTAYTLGAAAGTETVRAEVPGLTGIAVTFTLTSNADAANRLALVGPPSSSSASGASFAIQPAVQLRDANNNVVAQTGVVVTASVPNGHALVGNASATTDATGTATFTNLGVRGPVGTVTITFGTNGVTTVSASVTITAGAPALLAAAPNVPTQIAGQACSAVAIANLPVVLVQDADANPVAGVSVAFTVSSGTITPTSPATVVTDGSGIARLSGWTLPNVAGASVVTAALVGTSVSPVTFTATVTAAAAAIIVKTAGDGQAAVVNTIVPTPPSVVVRDVNGNGVSGVVVTFSVGTNSGAVSTDGNTFASNVSVTTDGSGAAQASWRLGTTAVAQSLAASVPGATPATFGATAIPGVASQLAVVTAPSSPTASGAAFTTQPAVQRRDQFGNAVPTSGVSVSISVLPPNSLTGVTTALTNANGIAAFATSGVSGPTGPMTITFSSANVTPATSVVTVTAGTPASITAGSPTQIAGQVGTAVAAPNLPTVLVRDGAQNPVPNVIVTFTASAGTTTPASPATVGTDANGLARLSAWTLPSATGQSMVTASLSGASGSPITFTASVTAGAPGSLSKTAGDGQTATVNTTVATAPTVVVRDANGNLVPDIGVTFTVGPSSGTVSSDGASFSSSATVSTDASGSAHIAWRLGTLAGAQTVMASVAGLTSVGFGAQAVAGTATQLVVLTAPNSPSPSGAAFTTQPAIQRRDQFGNPVLTSGVTVTASVAAGYSLAGTPTATTTGTGTATYANIGVAGPAGPVTITFASTGVSSTTTQVAIVAGTAAAMTKTAGDNQSATVNTNLTTQPAVQVVDNAGNPITNALVTFSIGINNGSVSSGGAFASSVQVATDASGQARVTWRLGTVAGQNTLVAVLAGVPNTIFTATSTAGAATQLVVVTTPNSPSASGAAFTTQPAIQRRDQFGNAVLTSGVAVSASVPVGTPFTLTGNTSASTAATGTAIYANLGVSGPLGPVTITFASAGVSSASVQVTVSAGTAASVAPNVSTTLSGVAGSAVPAANLAAVIVRDGEQNPVAGVAVTFTVAGGTIAIGGNSAPPNNSLVATSDANGIARINAWTLPTVVGTATVTATLAGVTGSPVTFTATVSAGTATQVAVLTPPNTPTPSGAVFTTPPVIQRRDQFGNAVPGANVTITVSAPQTGYELAGTTALTNAAGAATFTNLSLRGPLGAVTLTFSSAGVTPATVSVTIIAGAPASIGRAAGDGQSATVNTTVAIQPAAQVFDQDGNAVSGASVTFTAGGGFGAVSNGGAFAAAAQVTTDGTGTARITWRLGLGVGADTLTVTVNGLTTIFTATATAGAATQLAVITPPSSPVPSGGTFTTQPVVQRRDQFGNAVPGSGVPVTATVSTGYLLLGTTTATTNAVGNAAFTGLGVSGPVGTATISFNSAGVTSASANVMVAVSVQRTLTVTGSGNGVVTSAPTGINCTITNGIPSPSGCSAQFTDGTLVTLSNTPAGAYEFGGWSGACSGFGSCAVSMTQNQTVSASFSFGQWFRMSVPTTARLSGIWGSSSSQAFAVGTGGAILSFDGTRWETAFTGSLTSADLGDIWGSSASDVYVASEAVAGQAQVVHYDGRFWRITSVPAAISTANLYAVWGSSATNVFFAGENGTLLRFDGTTWTRIPTPTTSLLNTIWGSSPNDVYIVGLNGTALHYNGIAVTTVDLPNVTVLPGGPRERLSSVWGSSSKDVWIGGGESSGDLWHYNGVAWTKVTIWDFPGNVGVGVSGLWGTSDVDIWAVGTGSAYHYNGSTWTATTLPEGGLARVWGSGPIDVFATVYHTDPLRGNFPLILHFQ